MAQGLAFEVGRGASVRGALCPPGGAVPGNGNDNSTVTLSNIMTLTVDGAVAAGATSITLGVGEGVPSGAPIILAGQWLSFTNADGTVVPVKLTANVDASAAEVVTLPVEETLQDISDDATAEYPPIIGRRTNITLNRQGNRVTTYVFEGGSHESGRNATNSSGLTLDGNYSQLDAGYLTMLDSWNQGLPVFFQIEMPLPDQLATRGTVVQGAGSVTNMNVVIPADNIATGPVDAAFDVFPTEYLPQY